MTILTRRQAIGLTSAWLVQSNSWAVAATAPSASAGTSYAPLAALEKKVGGRLGVAFLNTANGSIVGHRLHERFAMCSTFKLALAAEVLRKIDQGTLQGDQWVTFGKADLMSHAPVAKENLGRGGMTVLAMAEAIQTTSDNTAANALLKLVGGPAGFTQLMRAGGDHVTRVDRMEPEMNRVGPGEERDTTTPHAAALTAQRQLLGGWLKPDSTRLLISWMEATETGTKRLRAGFPSGWRSGDKTGTGTGMAKGIADKYNDIAIAWPPGKAPIIVTSYYETPNNHGGDMRDEDQAVLAEVGRIATAWSLESGPR
jgi:beta-lactamase class A